MTRQQVEAFEKEINAALYQRARDENSLHDPITDGLIDIDRYLASSPKILWLLKEPWEDLAEGEPGGDWSIPEYLFGKGKIGNKGTWTRMAYVSFSIFNGFCDYSTIKYATEDPRVQDSLRHVGYINVKKFPG